MTRCLLVGDTQLPGSLPLSSTGHKAIQIVHSECFSLLPIPQLVTAPLPFPHICLLPNGRKQGHLGGGDQLQTSGDVFEGIAREGKRGEQRGQK